MPGAVAQNPLVAALQNPVFWTTGLTALAAIAALLYNIWQDYRRLRVRLRPVRRGHNFPGDESRTGSRIVFVVGLTMHNPGRTPNRLTAIRAWRNDVLVRHTTALSTIAPYATVETEVQIIAFENAPDVEAAFRNVAEVRIEVRAARGGRTQTFARNEFPPTN